MASTITALKKAQEEGKRQTNVERKEKESKRRIKGKSILREEEGKNTQ